MAFIDDPLDPNNPNNQQGQGQAPLVGSGSGYVGSGSGAAGAGGGNPQSAGGNPSAGVGPGGTGGWTNIQAYLGANQGDTGSANLLNKAVGDQFGQERQNFTNDSQKALSDAQSQADQNKITNDQADQYTKQAADSYWGQPQADGSISANGSDPNYKGIVDKFQHALNDKYSGPTDYNYALGNQAQQYGADLKDNPSFDQLMTNIYSQKAGSPLSAGQYDLQKQLDVNNRNLVDARNNLSNQYDQLVADRDAAVANTTTGLGNIAQNYQTNQNALHDYLSGKANDTQTKEQQAEADAKANYGQDFNTGLSGDAAALYGKGMPVDANWYDANGLPIKQNMTWQDLQSEQTNRGILQPAFDTDPGFYQPVTQALANNSQDLNNFYGNEENKYADTGDAQKRAYNALQDFLGNTGDRMTQGFDVGAPYKKSTFPGGQIQGRG